MSRNEYFGIVLAGGKSSRMGRDKSELTLDGMTFLEIQVEKMRKLGMAQIIISGKESSLPGTISVPDLIKDKGPLGGLYSSFLRCDGHPALVLSVDTPLISAETLQQLLDAYKEGDCDGTVLDFKGRPQPLIAVYNTNTASLPEELISSENLAVSSFLSRIKCNYVPFKGNPRELLNCNRPEDLAGLQDL